MKFEIIVAHEGTEESALDFAQEIADEFGCPIFVNEINDKDEYVRTLELPDKVDSTG